MFSNVKQGSGMSATRFVNVDAKFPAKDATEPSAANELIYQPSAGKYVLTVGGPEEAFQVNENTHRNSQNSKENYISQRYINCHLSVTR